MALFGVILGKHHRYSVRFLVAEDVCLDHSHGDLPICDDGSIRRQLSAWRNFWHFNDGISGHQHYKVSDNRILSYLDLYSQA